MASAAVAAVVGAGRRAVGGVGSAGTCRDHWASKRRCWRWLGVRAWRGGGEARGKWWAELVGERGRWSGCVGAGCTGVCVCVGMRGCVHACGRECARGSVSLRRVRAWRAPPKHESERTWIWDRRR